MGKLLKALAKVGLVEVSGSEAAKLEDVDDVDLDAIDAMMKAEAEQAKTQKRPGIPPQPKKTTPTRSTAAPTEVSEGRPFDEIYLEAGVPTAPYSAEKLIRLLEGLRAMDPATRKGAVVAMDSADDEWTLADVVLDAQRKIQALDNAKADLQMNLSAQHQALQDELTKKVALSEQFHTKINEKIAALQQELASTLDEVAGEKAKLQSQIVESSAACDRELSRMQSQIDVLADIPNTFAPSASEGQTP